MPEQWTHLKPEIHGSNPLKVDPRFESPKRFFNSILMNCFVVAVGGYHIGTTALLPRWYLKLVYLTRDLFKWAIPGLIFLYLRHNKRLWLMLRHSRVRNI